MKLPAHAAAGLALAWTLSAGLASATPAPVPAPEGEALLEPARAALEVPRGEDQRIALRDVLARFQEVTDWGVLMNAEARRLVEHSSMVATGPLRAEPEAVMGVVQAVLASQRFVLTVVREEPPRLLAVHSLDTTARMSVRQHALYVPAEDIARFADQRAVLVQTVVSLPSLDVRTLSNSLRGSVVDPNTLQIVPLGDSSELLIQGLGSPVADLVAMLLGVEALHAGVALEPAAALPALRAKGEARLPGGDEDGITLMELVTIYAERTGRVALVTDETARLLEVSQLHLGAPLLVQGADLPALFEELLLEQHFIVTELLAGPPALVLVQSLDTTARSAARQDARFVPAESLDACAHRPATIFQTMLQLPHSDVRTLSNSLRGMVVDPNLLQIIPVGDSSSLILQGLGRNLVRLRDMLQTIDASAAARPATVPAAQAPPPGDGG